MYNYYQPQQTNLRTTPQIPSQMLAAPPAPSGLGLKGRPVSSIEEVKAASIDFDGSIFFFPDLGNKRIFTKQINMDGTCSLFMYELKEFPIADTNSNNFVTREEFSNALEQFRATITSQFQQNQQQISPPITEKKEEKYEF